jgi:Domain of unknown function (DUF4157)
MARETPVRAHLPKQSADARGTRGPQAPAQNARCFGAAAQLAAVRRVLRHGPAFQLEAGGAAAAARAPADNRTGLPDRLKAGAEVLSGVSLDGVKVHYNSSKPAQLNALAYAQGSDIHLAPGQERHLPHEAWHIVQQAQGRVRPTLQMKSGVRVSDDARLEREADAMGAQAAGRGSDLLEAGPAAPPPVQRSCDPVPILQLKVVKGKLNVVGEDHAESKLKGRRDKEKAIAENVVGGKYWLEYQFKDPGWTGDTRGDSTYLRAKHLVAFIIDFAGFFIKDYSKYSKMDKNAKAQNLAGMNLPLYAIINHYDMIADTVKLRDNSYESWSDQPSLQDAFDACREIVDKAKQWKGNPSLDPDVSSWEKLIHKASGAIGSATSDAVSTERSKHMAKTAATASERWVGAPVGIWKVGQDHINDIMKDNKKRSYILTTQSEFNKDYPDLPSFEKPVEKSEGKEKDEVKTKD